jgi:hypothetical protein
MKIGQQNAFTYSNNNTDSKSLVKSLDFHIDLDCQILKHRITKRSARFFYENEVASLPVASLEILSPPPDQLI